MKGKFHFLSQDKSQLDYFIYNKLVPKLRDVKPDYPSQALNSGFRKDDYGDENEEYIKESIASTEHIETAVKHASSTKNILKRLEVRIQHQDQTSHKDKYLHLAQNHKRLHHICLHKLVRHITLPKVHTVQYFT